jgi:phosphoribosylformylglycinamidine synthase PurS subunit
MYTPMTTEHSPKAIVTVRYKDGVLDPQGATIQRALSDLGMTDIQSVKTGRTFELCLSPGASRDLVEKACRALLANPVIESFEIEMSA